MAPFILLVHLKVRASIWSRESQGFFSVTLIGVLFILLILLNSCTLDMRKGLWFEFCKNTECKMKMRFFSSQVLLLNSLLNFQYNFFSIYILSSNGRVQVNMTGFVIDKIYLYSYIVIIRRPLKITKFEFSFKAQFPSFTVIESWSKWIYYSWDSTALSSFVFITFLFEPWS